MKIFENLKKEEPIELIQIQNFPKPYYYEDDFIEIYYLLKKKLRVKVPFNTHYISYTQCQNNSLLSISQYSFFYNYFYNNVYHFFESIFIKEEFNYLLKYSNYHFNRTKIFSFVRERLLIDYLENVDLLKNKLDNLTSSSTFFKTYSIFTNDDAFYHFIAEEVLKNITIIDSGTCKIQFGIKNCFKNIILKYSSLHIDIIRNKPESFDLIKVRYEINRLKILKKSTSFNFINSFIVDLNELIFDLKDLYPLTENQGKKLNEQQMISLKELLIQWFPNNTSNQINVLLNSIIENNETIKEKYDLKVNVNEFCLLLSLLIKKGFTSKKHIEKLIDLKLFKHSSFPINKDRFRTYFSTYNHKKLLEINNKSSKRKKFLINFTHLIPDFQHTK